MLSLYHVIRHISVQNIPNVWSNVQQNLILKRQRDREKSSEHSRGREGEANATDK